MKSSTIVSRRVLLVIALAGALGTARQASSAAPGPSASVSTSASASAAPKEESPPARADRAKPWAPVFDATVPETPSDPPGKDEWASAPVAREVRVTDPYCKAQRIREWYRLSCQRTPWIEVISGAREGVSFGCRKEKRDDPACDESWVIFPARRGDRRALEFFSWSKYGPSPDSIATEQFLPGDALPWISFQGIHWGF